MNNRRKRKLIRPDLQVRGIFFGLGLALVTVAVQSVTMTFVLHRVATSAPQDGPAILQDLPQMLGWSALAAFVILTPIVLGLTLHATHSFAGPIYRIVQHLEEVVAGKDPARLSLRGSATISVALRIFFKSVQLGNKADGVHRELDIQDHSVSAP